MFKLALLSALVSSLATPPKVIAFHKDYSMETPILKAGDEATVLYDLARATCPHASTHGADTWTVSMYYQTGTGAIHSSLIANTPYPGAAQQYYTPTITFAQPGDYSVWFLCSSVIGSAYDSNLGQNWHIAVTA
ncbi:hypothetical protein HDV03_000466 [Kappamyces sp. JEL0829]|nr:hypothetical protein HDV03_000466 [Kappamyces sp. JEL0829]